MIGCTLSVCSDPTALTALPVRSWFNLRKECKCQRAHAVAAGHLGELCTCLITTRCRVLHHP